MDRKFFTTIIVVFLCCFAASKANTMIYEYDYYAEYNAFNSARVSVLDYPKASYEDISNELSEIEVSANDYALMTS